MTGRSTAVRARVTPGPEVRALKSAGQASGAMDGRMPHNSVTMTTSTLAVGGPTVVQTGMARMIHNLRQRTGITQWGIGAELGVTFATISRRANAKAKPTVLADNTLVCALQHNDKRRPLSDLTSCDNHARMWKIEHLE